MSLLERVLSSRMCDHLDDIASIKDMENQIQTSLKRVAVIATNQF